jgi:uncharacterized protein YndB with AHSA1/START domain
MDTATAVQSFSLTMNRNFKASKQSVYDAWTKEEAITSWFAPTSEMSTEVHEMEVKVGGKYRISMLEPDGKVHTMHGEYIALNPYDQIIFTWEWESDEEQVNSLVTIDLSEKNGTTDMVLLHEKLASQDSVDMHTEGWTGCIAQLEAFVS